MDVRSSVESASLCDWARQAAVMGQNTSFPMASKSPGLLQTLYPKKSDDVTAFLTICVQFPKGSVLNVLMVPGLCQSGQVSMLLNEQSKPRNAGGNFRPIMHWEETVRCFNCSLITHFALSSESLFPFPIFLSSQI